MTDDKQADLKVQKVAIGRLVPDPANARKHSEANLSAIANSLTQFGQRKPVVVTKDMVVVAGNGTMEAAKSLGWDELWVTILPWSDYAKSRAFALADNRTAELAEWDSAVLADQLLELDAEGWDTELLGFMPLNPPTDGEPDGEDTKPQLGDTKYAVIIDCDNELQQYDLLNQFQAQGYAARPLML